MLLRIRLYMCKWMRNVDCFYIENFYKVLLICNKILKLMFDMFDREDYFFIVW